MKRILSLFWVLALFVLMAIISSAEAATRFEIKQMVMKEAAHSSVPVPLAMAVAKVESDFNARALSSAGARGVMQIMPKTAQQEFGVHPEKLWNPEINIRLGVQFLERLYDQYDGRWDLVLSHYNGGTIKTGRPHNYTLAYVSKVQKWQQIYQEQANLWDVNDDIDLAQSETYSDYDDAQLTEWRMREVEEWDNVAYQQPRHDDFFEDDPAYDDRFGETRIIIVERREDDHRWRRPPPPPRPFHRGPPPRHFR